jgi:septal ring factor EnvC (AmiA/AmiB activator)
MNLDDIKDRINPLYADVIGTESYERRVLVGEIERLTATLAVAEATIEAVVEQRNVSTEKAYNKLVDSLQAKNQRINELEQIIKNHDIPVKTYAGGEAHYCTGAQRPMERRVIGFTEREMDRLNDAAKLAMFDDLQETAEELRIVNAEIREELERCEKRFSVLAWNLECALAIAKNLPMPTDEEEPPKKAGKRKVGGGKTATANAICAPTGA